MPGNPPMLHDARRHLVHALDVRSGPLLQRVRRESRFVAPSRSVSGGTSTGLFLAVFVVGIALIGLSGIFFASFGAGP